MPSLHFHSRVKRSFSIEVASSIEVRARNCGAIPTRCTVWSRLLDAAWVSVFPASVFLLPSVGLPARRTRALIGAGSCCFGSARVTDGEQPALPGVDPAIDDQASACRAR